MSLAAVAATAEDPIIPGISYSLPDGAAYVHARHWCRWSPSGSDTYSNSSGQQIIRFVISDGGPGTLLDLSTIRLRYKLNNLDGTRPLVLTGKHPMVVFQSVTIRVGGTQVERLDWSNRTAAMLALLRPQNRIWSDALTGMATDGADQYYVDGPAEDGVNPNSSRIVIGEILSGLLGTHYLLPLSQFPLEIQLELVSSPLQCVDKGAGGNQYSQSFNLNDCVIFGDTLSVDSAITEKINETLLSGHPLPLVFSSYASTAHDIVSTGGSWTVTHSRSFSRLQSVFITFSNPTLEGSPGFSQSNAFLSWHGAGSDPDDVTYNYQRDTFRFNLSAGAKRWPNFDLTSHAEAAMQLLKCIGHLGSDTGNGIKPVRYRSSQFIMGLDLEKVASTPAGVAAFTGLDTKTSVDQLRFEFQNVTGLANWAPTKQYVVCQFQCVAELRAEGVLLLE